MCNTGDNEQALATCSRPSRCWKINAELCVGLGLEVGWLSVSDASRNMIRYCKQVLIYIACCGWLGNLVL